MVTGKKFDTQLSNENKPVELYAALPTQDQIPLQAASNY